MTPNLNSEVDALLERGKVIPPVPDVVRARSLARARASVAAAAARPEGAPVVHRRPWVVALAASVTLAILAASAGAAFYYRAAPTPPAPSPRPIVVERAPTPVPSVSVPPLAAPNLPVTKPARPARSPSAQESYAAELELLHRAQAAYAGRDFAAALVLVAEHGRRFPNGRLAEEREALRVRSLASSGRTDEAHRAAAAFAERFPRSVLLPRLEKE